MYIDTRIVGKLGAMHLVRDENGSVVTGVDYSDAELAAMPISLRNEYLDAVEAEVDALLNVPMRWLTGDTDLHFMVRL